jgi:hypothetical protein
MPRQYRRAVESSCPHCGYTRLVPPSVLDLGRGKFCSRECQWASVRESQPDPDLTDDGLTARIPLRNRHGIVISYALIDAADAPLVSQWRWSLTRGYAKRVGWADGRQQLIYLHRLILGLGPDDDVEVDHISRDKLDNRRANLRTAIHVEQMQNVPGRPGSSQYRGVHWDSQMGKWVASLSMEGKNVYLGAFSDELAAAEAARAGRARLMPYATD